MIAALSLAMLLPQYATASAATDTAGASSAATATDPAEGTPVEEVGPGLYNADTGTFQISESDSFAGLIARVHSVSTVNGAANPESAPDDRADMGVFGDGWEAQIEGGQLNRELDLQDGAAVVTDLNSDQSVRYTLQSTLDTPDGGSVRKYTAPDGSQLTETSKWDTTGEHLVTTVSEILNVDLATTESGDDTFTDDAGAPIPATSLKPTFTYKQVAGASDWRVTGTGTKALGTTTVDYDAQGRVKTILEPARGDTPATSTALTYAASTTATASAPGDFAGLLKQITVTEGQTTQTVARYAYTASGLLSTVTNPVESPDPVAEYGYDNVGRVQDITSPANGQWDLDFTAATAEPNVTPTSPDQPSADDPLTGTPGFDADGVAPPATDFVTGEITDAQSYPRACSGTDHWMWYTKKGCAAKVAHYGWHSPYFKWTPTGKRVVGINGDHCTSSPDKPAGMDFRAACDMHDYGYGLIGNTYKGYKYYLDRSKKHAVDLRFWNTLAFHTCPHYWWKYGTCYTTAGVYLAAVTAKGRPVNGANGTH